MKKISFYTSYLSKILVIWLLVLIQEREPLAHLYRKK